MDPPTVFGFNDLTIGNSLGEQRIRMVGRNLAESSTKNQFQGETNFEKRLDRAWVCQRTETLNLRLGRSPLQAGRSKIRRCFFAARGF